jgi:hypothetical protein
MTRRTFYLFWPGSGGLLGFTTFPPDAPPRFEGALCVAPGEMAALSGA